MSLLTSSIDLDTIIPPSLEKSLQFKESELTRLANLFLRAGDSVKPIILRRITPISFQVLEGYFEYFAAIKAQEIDFQFTAIRGYVVPPDLESTILEQYQFLGSLSLPNEVKSVPNSFVELSQDSIKMEQSLTRLEKKIELIAEVINAIARLENKLTKIENDLSNVKIQSAEFQNFKEDVNNKLVKSSEPKSKNINSDLDEILLPFPPIVNIKTATRDEILERLSYLSKNNIGGFSSVNPDIAANSLFKAQKSNWKNLTPIKDLRCGIGKAKISTLDTVFTL